MCAVDGPVVLLAAAACGGGAMVLVAAATRGRGRAAAAAAPLAGPDDEGTRNARAPPIDAAAATAAITRPALRPLAPVGRRRAAAMALL